MDEALTETVAGGNQSTPRRPRGLHRLSHQRVLKLKEPGKYEDGGGLRLVVDHQLNKRWVLRVTINGKRRELGLGSFPEVPLETARNKATELRSRAAEGTDRRAIETKERRARGVTFEEVFWAYFEIKQHNLSNAKHLKQWPSTMKAYVFPVIGQMPVNEVAAGDIIRLLQPIWYEKAETARRVLQRLEAVFKSAIVRGFRDKASPCIGIAGELGTTHRKVAHFRALPYCDLPELLQIIRNSKARSATKLCFTFLVLAASRSSEARFATWSEIDRDTGLWVIPAERMKARREHIVPLSDQAIAILEEARQLGEGDLIFAAGSDKALSDMTLTKLLRDLGWAERCTVHGSRSSFREWCALEAKVPDRIAEIALAHVDKDRVQAAYLRSNFVEERRKLMQSWADFVLTPA
jgi:integrase